MLSPFFYHTDEHIDGKKFLELTKILLFEFEFTEDAVSHISDLITDLEEKRCYEVRAKYIGAKKKKEVQGAVYRYAQQHEACYSRERSKSIFFNDDGDLEIVLWFREESSATSFRTFLSQWYLNNPMVVNYGDVVMDDMKILYRLSKFEHVQLSHYTATESYSPVQALEELCSVSTSGSHVSVLSSDNPVAQFQCMEGPEVFSLSRPIKCHIKPQSGFEEFVNNDDNNLLAVSRVFNDFFEGRRTIDPITGEDDLPLFAIKPPNSREFKEELIGSPPLKRKRVEVLIECRDDTVGEKVCERLKTGSEKMSDTQFKTFVHVEDPNMFCDSLEWKYMDICKRWKAADTD